MIKTVYIAGPYRDADAWRVEQNIREAERYGYTIAQLGAYPVIPHSNTRAYFESAQADPNFWLGGTMRVMESCDAVFFLPAYERSSGATAERARAGALSMPVFDTLAQLGAWLSAT